MHRFRFLSLASTVALSAADMLGGGGTPPPVGDPPPAANPPAANPPPAGDPPPAWYAQHPDENVRNLMGAKNIGDPMVLATQYYHANKALSGAKDVVPIPGDDAKPEQLDAFYAALGRPEKPDGYQWEFGQDVTVHDGFKTWAQGTFHKYGLTAKQAAGIVADWQNFAKETGAADTTQRQERETADIGKLRTELGGEQQFNAYVAEGQKAFKALNPPAEVASAIEGSAGTYAFLWLMGQLGKKMGGEAGFITTGGNGGDIPAGQLTKEQAQVEINRLQGDAEFSKKYLDAKHPEHRAAVQRMEQLYSRLHS